MEVSKELNWIQIKNRKQLALIMDEKIMFGCLLCGIYPSSMKLGNLVEQSVSNQTNIPIDYSHVILKTLSPTNVNIIGFPQSLRIFHDIYN